MPGHSRGNCAAGARRRAAERSGWNCAPQKLPRCTTAAKAAPWSRASHAVAVSRARRSCARSRRSRRRRCPSSSGSLRTGCKRFQPMCGTRMPGPDAQFGARGPAAGRGIRHRLPRSLRTASACRGRCRAAACRSLRSVSTRPASRSRAMAVRGGADAGQDHPRRRRGSRPHRAVSAASTPRRSQRIAHRPRLAPPHR